ncbi:hypothetical protein G3480_10865 [Thiorhodococcus mannitoliphagus]|uniref:O-antigen ligase family protein n=1 Tax=Thiorhodococcus mannitoliphagus TaxID=329406 RepID=A0A6P1DRD1_9GAMM|nr:hypothetical protein [Thiorhodococcus mannitoliphagus]NEX20807.1 hypothetical protein [Thiorhodococcus mannitoliphagus]
MITVFLLLVVLVLLPWPWYVVASVAGMGVRPVLIGGGVLILYGAARWRLLLKPINIKLMLSFFAIYFVWLLPLTYYENPHWDVAKLLGFGVHASIAFILARIYLLATLDSSWRFYWPIVAVLFLFSSVASFYYAFGTLVADSQIENSTDFIHRALYGEGVFSDPEAAKGIRHTMAIVPVLLLGMVFHNYDSRRLFAILVSLSCVYLIFFSFSRSAWLALLLLAFPIARYLIASARDHFALAILSALAFVGGLVVWSVLFPEQFSWVLSIVGDRVSDDRSTSGRIGIVIYLLSSMSFIELLIGYNHFDYGSPHNLVLDALIQSGVLGALSGAFLLLYVGKIYLGGLYRTTFDSTAAAVFVAPALVRMVTAGSGMLHLAELTGLFIAMNLNWSASLRARLVKK